MLKLAVLELVIFALMIAFVVAVVWLIVKLVRNNRK
jgi:hypothetical protein